MTITAGMVKELRDKTGAGMMDCKKALSESSGDFERAIDILRKKGLASAAKKAGRKASDGLIYSYIHLNKIGVLLELNCETDFVAKTDDFSSLAKDIAMHIAAANPLYRDVEDIPSAVMEREKEIYKSQVTNKPAHVVDKIIEGKIEKFYGENCLMRQNFIKDPEQKVKISDLIAENIAKLGENVVIRRFVRFQLGETV